MKMLVACEFSGIVRNEFAKLGWDAWSCDLLPTEQAGQHIQGDVLNYLYGDWDLIIAHPPCQYLAVSGARWWKQHKKEQGNAIQFFMQFVNCTCRHIAIENPVSIISTVYRKPDQIIQPWQFGHGETKKTCLWLKNLSLLCPTEIVSGRDSRVHRMPPSKDRWKNRSRTYLGIAKAMASQWTNHIRQEAGNAT